MQQVCFPLCFQMERSTWTNCFYKTGPLSTRHSNVLGTELGTELTPFAPWRHTWPHCSNDNYLCKLQPFPIYFATNYDSVVGSPVSFSAGSSPLDVRLPLITMTARRHVLVQVKATTVFGLRVFCRQPDAVARRSASKRNRSASTGLLQSGRAVLRSSSVKA